MGDEWRTISTSALTTKVFCEHHNNTLSSLDAEAGRFFGELQQASEVTGEQTTKSRPHTFNGDRIERWMLKAALAMWEGKVFGLAGMPIQGNTPQLWKRVLLRLEDFPAGWGFYASLSSSPVQVHANTIDVVPLANEGGVAAIKFGLMRAPFFLLLHDPPAPSVWGHHRPAYIQFRNITAAQTLRLRWRTPSPTGGVHYDWVPSGFEYPIGNAIQ